MSKRTTHVSVDLYALSALSDAVLAVVLRGSPVYELTPERARVVINEMVAQGHRFLSLGKPCDGFTSAAGCPGHTSTLPTYSLSR